MDEEDVEICMFSLVILLTLQQREYQRRRRFWVHPYLQRRFVRGRYYADVSALIILQEHYYMKINCRPLVPRHGSISGNLSRKFPYE